MVKTLNISSKKLGSMVNSRSSPRRVSKLADGLPHVLALAVLSKAFRAFVGSGLELRLELGLDNFPIVLTVSRHTAIRRSSSPSSL